MKSEYKYQCLLIIMTASKPITAREVQTEHERRYGVVVWLPSYERTMKLFCKEGAIHPSGYQGNRVQYSVGTKMISPSKKEYIPKPPAPEPQDATTGWGGF